MMNKSNTNNKIIRLDELYMEKAVRLMIRGYYHDPLVNYIIPDRLWGRSLLLWYMSLPIRCGLQDGEIYTNSNVNGLAIWISPESSKMTIWEIYRAGLFIIPFKIGVKAAYRLKIAMDYTTEVEKRFTNGECWHLLNIVVDTMSQNKGLGGLLLQHTLQRADKSGKPCYLETFNKKSISFYERYGFKVVFETSVPKNGPRFWAMLRESDNKYLHDEEIEMIDLKKEFCAKGSRSNKKRLYFPTKDNENKNLNKYYN